MRAYLIENPGAPPCFGTVEADAKRAARDGAGTVTPTEIPDTKRDLVPWLNELLLQHWIDRSAEISIHNDPLGLEFDPKPGALNQGVIDEHGNVDLTKIPRELRPRVAGFCDACGQSAEGKLKLARGTDLDAFTAWLGELQLGDLWAMQRAGELIRERARELGAEYQERTVQ